MLVLQSIWVSGWGSQKELDETKFNFAGAEGGHVSFLNVYKGFLQFGKSSQWCHKNFVNYQAMSKRNYRTVMSDKMRVIIDTWGHEFTIEVGLKEPVLEIKGKIAQLLGIPMASQTLAVWGWELVDGLDMEDYPIVTEGTKINLTIKRMEPPFHRSSTIPIIIKFSAIQHHIEVNRTETVSSLKDTIHILYGTPIKRMSLFFCGIELEEDIRNLSEYGICEFSEILVFLKALNRPTDDPPSRRLSLVVQTSSSLLNASRIPLKMKDSSTVNEMRQLLLSRKLLPIDDYLFIHKQRTMRDNCSLRWHGVEDGDPIYVFKGAVYRSGY